MRLLSTLRVLLVFIVLFPGASFAQSSQAVSSASVPRLIHISGVFRPAVGQPAAVETITLSIYANQEGGAPVWQETQTIAVDAQGRYALLLGATHADGIPAAIFGSGDAQWLGTVFERAGEVEGPRVRITSVPYALRASDADTLGGRPATDYLLATPAARDAASAAASADAPPAASNDVLPGSENVLAKYTAGGANVGNSALYEANGLVGINTTAPGDALHVRFTNTNGGMTGYAVQNLGASATSYSGMLFYDQNGALGQFQGFNNSTHEYRINNIARVTPGGAFNGSINFMTGSTSRFFVGSTGSIGIGTATPFGAFEVSNALSGLPVANMLATTYSANPFGSLIYARKARGTAGAPSAALTNDTLAAFGGRGYGATGFGGGTAGMTIRAAENFTDAAQGASLQFLTVPTGTAQATTAMTISPSGNLGIGTTAPGEAVEIARNGNSVVSIDAFGTDVAAGVALRTARGTQAAPTAVQAGDILGYFALGGWAGAGPTGGFADAEAGMAGYAAENWTPTTRGAGLGFFTTPVGLPEDPSDLPRMVVLPSGDVGIGTGVDVNGLPTVTDKLQVVGDIRIGTTGTNGCLKNFAGNPLAGTCASDLRFKKDVTPFSPVLDRLTALQPVHYAWRAAEFPDRHFGDQRAYGLIAQDVEKVLPELVATNNDGFKAVDYSKLPLLTIQAVKDLTSQVTDLKSENDALKQRLADVERLLNELLNKSSRR